MTDRELAGICEREVDWGGLRPYAKGRENEAELPGRSHRPPRTSRVGWPLEVS